MPNRLPLNLSRDLRYELPSKRKSGEKFPIVDEVLHTPNAPNAHALNAKIQFEARVGLNCSEVLKALSLVCFPTRNLQACSAKV